MASISSHQSFRTVFMSVILVLNFGCLSDSDLKDAKAVVAKVHSQMKSRDYAAIYRESAPRFKSVGSESQFVSTMQEISQVTGELKKADSVSFKAGVDSSIGKTYTLLYELEFEGGTFNQRLILSLFKQKEREREKKGLHNEERK